MEQMMLEAYMTRYRLSTKLKIFSFFMCFKCHENKISTEDETREKYHAMGLIFIKTREVGFLSL